MKREGAANPETIRAAMRQTRAGLTRKLEQLKDRLLHPLGAPHTGASTPMAQKRTTKSKSAATSAAAKSKPPKAKTASAKAASQQDGSAKSAKSSPSRRRASASKSGAKGRKRTSSRSTVSTVASATGEVLGEVLTGAAVGAVAGAAERIQDEPLARAGAANSALTNDGGSKRTKSRKGSQDVVGEMLSGAAAGAVAGAVDAVLPMAENAKKKTAKKR